MADPADPTGSESAVNDKPLSARKWRLELFRASKVEQNWRKEARRIRQMYRAERSIEMVGVQSGANSNRRSQLAFNILFSNTQTLLPALYGRTPRPDVRQRWQQKPPQMPVAPPVMPAPPALPSGNPIQDAQSGLAATQQQGQQVQQAAQQQQIAMMLWQAQMLAIETAKQAATILERCLGYTMSEYDFDGTVKFAVMDYLLTGRGVLRIRYEPGIEQGGYTGGPAESLTCETVHWDDFRVSPAKSWDEVRAVSFRSNLTREQLVAKFGAKGKSVPLDQVIDYTEQTSDTDPTGQGTSASNRDELKRATVWETWDKDTRKVYFFTDSGGAGAGMDPTARGSTGKYAPDQLLAVIDDPLGLPGFFPCPKPIYSVWSTDTMVPVPEYVIYEGLAEEINTLTRRIKATVAAIKYRGLYNATTPEIADLLKAEDSKMIGIQGFDAMAAIANQVLVLPVDGAVKALAEMYVARKEAKDALYEVTGISDIVRGVSSPSETLGAQEIKSQWGALRIQDRRRDIEHMIVDVLRLKAHVIATLFEPETLSQMSGIQAGPEIMAFLQSEGLRNYNIDVETDSIVATDRMSDQKAVAGLIEGLTKYFVAMAPLATQGFPMAVIKSLALAAIKPYPQFGREVEDAINQIPDQVPQALPGPVSSPGQAMSAGPGGGATPGPVPQLPNLQTQPPGVMQ